MNNRSLARGISLVDRFQLDKYWQKGNGDSFNYNRDTCHRRACNIFFFEASISLRIAYFDLHDINYRSRHELSCQYQEPHYLHN